MAKSLQEQLMGAGLVDDKKARSIKKEQRKKRKQLPKGKVAVDQDKERLKQEREAKAERDRQLNLQIKAKADERAIQAQIKQLIEDHGLPSGEGDIGYQFADGKKIRKIYVTAQQQNQIFRGQLRIVRQGENFRLVPRPVAEKIIERDESYVIAPSSDVLDEVGEDDPYADYKIPDDLMW